MSEQLRQRYTPSERARRILAGAVRDYTGLGKGCYCHGDWVCGDCAIAQAIDREAAKQETIEQEEARKAAETVPPAPATPAVEADYRYLRQQLQRVLDDDEDSDDETLVYLVAELKRELAAALPAFVPPRRAQIEDEIAALDAAGADTNADGVDPCGGDDAWRRGAWFALKWSIGQYPVAPAVMIRDGLAETKQLMAEGERWMCLRESLGWPDASVSPSEVREDAPPPGGVRSAENDTKDMLTRRDTLDD